MASNEMVKVPAQGEVQRQLSPQEQKLGSMRTFIAQNMKAIASVLPSHIKPERLARIVVTTLQRTPKLLDCSRESFISCILACAALGLEPDGLLGQAYLVPFGKTCTLVPGYKGLLKLAYQSGEVSNIDAQEVRLGDRFSYSYGTNPHLEHVPAEVPVVTDDKGQQSLDPTWRPGAISHFYAVAIMKDGSRRFRVMKRWEVDEIRDDSQGYRYARDHGGDSPWITDYREMGKKTVLRAICKLLPASIEKDNLARAVSMDERGDRGLPQGFEAVVDVPSVLIPTDEAQADEAPEISDAKPANLTDVAAKSKAEREQKPVVKIEQPV